MSEPRYDSSPELICGNSPEPRYDSSPELICGNSPEPRYENSPEPRYGSSLVVAPMMGRTDAAGCAYLRTLLPQARLFTEMIPAAALAHGGARAHTRLSEYFALLDLADSGAASRAARGADSRSKAHNGSHGEPRNEPDNERVSSRDFSAVDSNASDNNFGDSNVRASPLALQLGGSDAHLLYRAVAEARNYPFCEINLNLGCPSPRVGKGGFGAFLIKDALRAASCVSAMRSASESGRASASIPISVKTRIGVDELDSYEHFRGFIERLHSAGCEIFYIHARKAWLNGLSVRDNRRLPPLRADFVERLQKDMPRLRIIYNGGIADGGFAKDAIARFGGVMVGRALWRAPYGFRAVGAGSFNQSASRREIARLLFAMAEKNLTRALSDCEIAGGVTGGVTGAGTTSCHSSNIPGTIPGNSNSNSPSHSRARALGNSIRLLMRAMSLYHAEPCAREWRKFLLLRVSSLRQRGSFDGSFDGNFDGSFDGNFDGCLGNGLGKNAMVA